MLPACSSAHRSRSAIPVCMGSRISPIVVSQAAMAHRMAAISSTPSRDRASSISSVPSPISMPASSARSGFHHSMNYRSAVVIGPVRHVEDETERADALDAIIDHVVPGRSQTLRPATRKELAATAVLALPLHEASVKVRQGAPVDEPSDAATGSWAGHMPVGRAHARGPGRRGPDHRWVQPRAGPVPRARASPRSQPCGIPASGAVSTRIAPKRWAALITLHNSAWGQGVLGRHR